MQLRTLCIVCTGAALAACGQVKTPGAPLSQPPVQEAVTATACLFPGVAISSVDPAPLAHDYVGTTAVLYKGLTGPGNMVFSPYMTTGILAQLYAGSDGNTTTHMAQTLGWSMTPSALPAAHQALTAQLLQDVDTGNGNSNTLLSCAGRLWAAPALDIKPAFQTTVHDDFGAPVATLDFNSPALAAQTINDWVNNQTNHLIPSLFGNNDLPASTLLVDTAALYFKAAWQTPFTQSGDLTPFHNASGQDSNVAMLSRTAAMYPYAQTAAYQAVQIPYNDNHTAMTVVLPTGTLTALEATLDANSLNQLTAGLTAENVLLTLPPFSFDHASNVQAALQAAGLTDLFGASANLTGITDHAVQVTSIVEKASISVDAVGTEAAAAGGAGIGPGVATTQAVNLLIDKPFLFLITDTQSGVILYIGRVDTL